MVVVLVVMMLTFEEVVVAERLFLETACVFLLRLVWRFGGWKRFRGGVLRLFD